MLLVEGTWEVMDVVNELAIIIVSGSLLSSSLDMS